MENKFDIVFSFDTTQSMYSCLEEVRNNLSEMITVLNKEVPAMQIGLLAHGDYCDSKSKYVTKHQDFTTSGKTLTKFARKVEKTNGGDWAECYELVFRKVQTHFTWRDNSQRALVVIGDAIPHDKEEEQNYLHLDWKEEIKSLRDMGIKIYAVQCLFAESAKHFYQSIAAQTFGYYFRLEDFHQIRELLQQICFREAGLKDTFTRLSIDKKMSVRRKFKPLPQSMCVGEEFDSDTENDNATVETDIRIFCMKCKKKKPPNEFPTTLVSKKCRHHPGICYRCLIEEAKLHGKCPQGDCGVSFDDDQCRQQIAIFDETMKRLFRDYSEEYEENQKKCLKYRGDVISVSSINGEICLIDYQSNMTIQTLKEKIEESSGLKPSRQKLFFNEDILKNVNTDGHPNVLTDYSICKNDSLNLIVPLYCIPTNCSHVFFDLSWEFPNYETDFLDASCFAFSNTELIQVIDWNHPRNDYFLKDSIIHTTRNEKTSDGRYGHQVIEVYMAKLPDIVTHLYFSLSSWKADSLEAFSNPCLQFYDASEPETNLCGTTFHHALKSKAVIMFSVVRSDERWLIFECDSECVNGNTKMYNPIRKRIVDLIARGN